MKTRILLLTAALFWSLSSTQAQYPEYPGGYDPNIGHNAGGYAQDDGQGYGNYYDDEPSAPGQRIQIALLLDASGSMNQLIDQARAQLWSVVNELAWGYDQGYQPRIEIGVYAYGSTRYSPRDGYIQQLVPFTEDLDWVSDVMYDIQTGGRMEYPGWAIQSSVGELNWSPYREDAKLLYVAGNEDFRQGPVDFRNAIRSAQSRGITVNTIYCGPYNEGIYKGWKEAADYGGGMYSSMDLNGPSNNPGYNSPSVTYNYTTVNQLNIQLNQTYVPYGAYGNQYYQRLQRQDQYVGNYGNWYLCQRVFTKASPAYRTYHWDLVAAYHAGRVDLNRLPDNQLPPAMRGMSIRERQQYLIQMQANRARIQGEIQRVARRPDSQPRTASATQTAGNTRPRTLDQAIVNTTREQVNQTRSSRPATRTELQPTRTAPRQATPVQRFDTPQQSSRSPITSSQSPVNNAQPNRSAPVQTRTLPQPSVRPTTSQSLPVRTWETQPSPVRSTPAPAPTRQVETRSSQPTTSPAPSRRVETPSQPQTRTETRSAPATESSRSPQSTPTSRRK